MPRPLALFPVLALAAALLAVSGGSGEARTHRHCVRPHHHRHRFGTAQTTYPLTAGLSRIRINGVGEVIGPNEQAPHPGRLRRDGRA